MVKKNTKGLDELRAKMLSLRTLSLTVGVQGQKGQQTYGKSRDTKGRFRSGHGPTVAMVALFNEFGTIDIPARSFLRGALFVNKSEIEAFIANELGRFIKSKKMQPVTVLRSIGKHVAKHVRHRINTTSHWAKPNAPNTIEKKGYDRPLHDTDKLSKSITWAVRSGGNIIAEGS